MDVANPYAAPEVASVAATPPIETDEDYEAVRREHLAAESTLRVLGWLSLLQSVELAFFALTWFFLRVLGGAESYDPLERAGMGLGVLLGLVLIGASGWRNARELVELEPQQRRKHTMGLALGTAGWVLVALFLPSLVRFFLKNPLVLGLLPGSLVVSTPLKLYAFWSPRAEAVFSEHYRTVVIRWTRRTVRPGVPLLAWALIALTLTKIAGEVLLVLAVMGKSWGK